MQDRRRKPKLDRARWWEQKPAPWATDPAASRGRLHPEPESPTRSPFQRDRDRIVHAAAFRRLKQKTQVFIAHEGDHFRTRLTHSLEVAQIARSVARTLGLDEDLAETVALAHDLGHPPFGHAGEDALDACMAAYGGFDHNAQTLRVLTKLELRYPAFDGLNLTWETLEGVVKHNGPLLKEGRTLADLPVGIQEYAALQDLELGGHAGPEAQVAALADDIAYNNHDIDDGLRAGLFQIEDLYELAFVGDAFRTVRQEFPELSRDRWTAEAVRRLIGARIGDLVEETRRRVAALAPDVVEDVRAAPHPIVAFSEDMRHHELGLREFLRGRMYRHHRVSRMRSIARRVLSELFERFLAEPELMPERWRQAATAGDQVMAARAVCDYLAGMTDAYAIEEHRRVFEIGALF